MFRTEQRLYDLAKQGLYRKLIEFSNQERFSYHLEELYNTFCEAFNLNPTQSLTKLEYLLMTDIGLFDFPLEDKRTLVEVFFQEKVYGSLILTEDFLILNTTSRFQLKRGKEMINKLAGITVIHHRDFIKS